MLQDRSGDMNGWRHRIAFRLVVTFVVLIGCGSMAALVDAIGGAPASSHHPSIDSSASDWSLSLVNSGSSVATPNGDLLLDSDSDQGNTYHGAFEEISSVG